MGDCSRNYRIAPIAVGILVAAGALSCGPSSRDQAEPEERSNRYLLLDSRIVESTSNAQLRIGSVSKHEQNPLLREDKPWEPRFDNVYANVIYDEQEEVYKCWYSPFIVDERTTSTPIDERTPQRHHYMSVRPRSREMGVCYAVSRDGIEWTKPELGLVEFEGSTANNIVMRGEDMRGMFYGPHGAGVIKDMREPDPARRYKMFFRAQEMAVAFSADGVRWSAPILAPQIEAPGDTHNIAFWDPRLHKYIGFTRLKYGRPSVRQVARTESADFLDWTKAEVVLEGVERRLQTHDMVVFPAAGVYIGLLGMMEFPDADDNASTKQHIELAWSPDSRQWHRIEPGRAFIDHSDATEIEYDRTPYDWGNLFASAPIFHSDETRIYYGSSDWYFFDWRKGYLALATMRPDGWAGYEPIERTEQASVTTVPLPWSGRTPRLTADIGPNGSVIVTALHASGPAETESAPILESVTDGEVRGLEDLAEEVESGEPVRLRFDLQDAKLYSFRFADE
ncbi:MAG: hypothetical protein OXN96_03650 [Bryobacterales bacterium]|nr:hypothetical protein [Bryobacterales bacterium]MDE0621561.1 hypothetical protein [Bryobacterales bacterium]